MSVILDALKRVQDENRRRDVGADGIPTPPAAVQGSSGLLRRLSAPSDVAGTSVSKPASPAVAMVILALALTVVIVGALWFFQPRLAEPEVNRGRPLLAGLTGGSERPLANQPRGATPPMNSAVTEPFAPIRVGNPMGQLPQEFANGTAAEAAEPGPANDLRDLSAQLGQGAPGDTSSQGSFRLESSREPPGRTGANGADSYLDLTSELSGARESTGGAGQREESAGAGDADGRANVPQPMVDPGVRVAFEQGVRAQKQGDFKTAEEAYLRALKHDPDNSTVNSNLGALYEKDGQLVSAERYLRQSIAVQPDNANAHNNLGVVLYRLGNYDAALLEFKRTLVLDPDRLDAHTNRGLIFTRWGEYGEAEQAFRRVLEIDPDNALAHYNLGLVYEELEAIDLAIEEYYTFVRVGGADHPKITDYLDAHLRWLEARQDKTRATRRR